MTKEYGIVRVSNGKLVEDGMFIPDSRLKELSGSGIRYLITNGIHKNAVSFDAFPKDILIWDGMHISELADTCSNIRFERVMDMLREIPAKLNNKTLRINFKKD